MMPPGQPVLQGASLRSWFTSMFANYTVQGFDLRPDGAEPYDNTVIEHGTWAATLQPKNGSASQTVGGTYLVTYARLADGDVRITRDAFNGFPG